MKKTYFIVFLTILIGANLLLIAYFMNKKSTQSHSSAVDPTEECRKKDLVWEKDEYEIPSQVGQQFILKIANKEIDTINYLLKPSSNAKKFSSTEYCMAGLSKLPVDERMPTDLKKDIQENKKGVIVSLMNRNTISPIVTFTMNIQVFAKRESNEKYNVDKAFEAIVNNYIVTKENNKIRLTLKGQSETTIFMYDIVEYEGKNMIGKDLELISEDKGKTWKVKIVTNSANNGQ